MRVLPGETEIQSQERALADLNCQYLQCEMERLKLLLARRALWLKEEWKSDPLKSYSGMVISDERFDHLLREPRKGEAEFYEASAEVSLIDKSIIEAEARIDQVREAAAAEGVQFPLDLLSGLFGLTPFEMDVLLLTFAPEMDPDFERLYAYVQDDLNRRYPTPGLSLEIFGRGGARSGIKSRIEMDARKSLMSDAPLRRFRLVVLDSSPGPTAVASSLRPLRMEERIVDYILGSNHPDERLTGRLKLLMPAPLTSAQARLVVDLERTMRAEEMEGRIQVLNLVGSKGVGRRAVACELCSRLGAQAFSIDPSRLPETGPDLVETAQMLEREAILAGAALYFELPEGGTQDEVEVRAMELIERVQAFVIVGSTRQRHFDHPSLAVDVPEHDSRDRLDLWRQALQIDSGACELDGHLRAAAEQFAFGPHETVQAASATRAAASLRGSPQPAASDVWQACRAMSGAQMHDLAQKITPAAGWDEIVLPQEAMQQLREIASQVENRTLVYDDWGFGQRLSRGRGINALFCGPSGTGKTMAAEVLASHLRLDLYRIDLAGVVSKYIGETEKNLKRIFDAAERSGAVLFFDEADALFGKRTEVKDSHDRYANIEVSYLLQRMEDYSGLAVLATNKKSALDQAFLRRLRFLVDLPLPDFASRRLIWRKTFPVEVDLDGLDYDLLARMEITGGNIRNISLNAAFLAAGEGAAIGMAHVMRAARREYAKIGRLATEAELGGMWT